MSTAGSAETQIPKATLPGYTPLPVTVLSSVGHLGVDLYATDEGGQHLVLYCAHDYHPSRDEWQDLLGQHVRQLFVRNSECDRLLVKLRAELDTIVSESTIPCTERLDVLQLAVAGQLRTAFQLIKVDQAVTHCAAVGSRIVKVLTSREAAAGELVSVLRYHRGTFTHLMNVSIYAVLLAEALGEADEENLSAVAAGGALHDIGKRHVPTAILDQPGKLTARQREIIAAHPQLGFEEIRYLPGLSWGQLMMVYQHHERIDGHGYPTRVSGEKIHPWARLCAVVDVFEAMTGLRPYREPASVSRVLKMLEEEKAGNHLDVEMVRCWKRAICEG